MLTTPIMAIVIVFRKVLWISSNLFGEKRVVHKKKDWKKRANVYFVVWSSSDFTFAGRTITISALTGWSTACILIYKKKPSESIDWSWLYSMKTYANMIYNRICMHSYHRICMSHLHSQLRIHIHQLNEREKMHLMIVESFELTLALAGFWHYRLIET